MQMDDEQSKVQKQLKSSSKQVKTVILFNSHVNHLISAQHSSILVIKFKTEGRDPQAAAEGASLKVCSLNVLLFN